MRSPPKNKRDAGATAVPAWHPNFRNRETLPDLKVVRTTFFINGAAVLAALGALFAFTFQELEIATIKKEIATWEAQIERDRAGSTEAVGKFRRFQAAEKLVKEAQAVVAPRLSVASLWLRLGETLPENIALISIELRATDLVLTGIVRGAPELASGYASQYASQLETDEVVGKIFESVAMTGLARNATTGNISFELTLQFPVKK